MLVNVGGSVVAHGKHHSHFLFRKCTYLFTIHCTEVWFIFLCGGNGPPYKSHSPMCIFKLGASWHSLHAPNARSFNCMENNISLNIERKSCRFRMTWRWMNAERIVMFLAIYPCENTCITSDSAAVLWISWRQRWGPELCAVFGKHFFRNHSDQNVATETAKINTRLMTRFGSSRRAIDRKWSSLVCFNI